MDEIVRDSGVIWEFAIKRFKHIGCLLLSSMFLVRWRRVGDQSKRIKYPGLNVFRVGHNELMHSGLVIQRPRAVGDSSSIFEYQAERMDETVLAVGDFFE